MCHVSVGHVARAVEEAGIPTVSIYIRAFRHRATQMHLPRTLVTPHLLGRTVGAPGDAEDQRQVVRAALHMLESATEPATIVDFAQPNGGAL